MKRLSIAERFKIPLDGSPDIKFYTKQGLLLAHGFTRVVLGGRGPYIEFESCQVIHDNIHIPKHALHKLENSLSYYHEYRSNDKCFVKLYDQKMEVSYADYKVGMWYISPDFLKTDEFDKLILPLYINEEEKEEEKSLFDEL